MADELAQVAKESRVPVLVRLPPQMREALRREAQDSGRSMQAIVERALLHYFAVRQEPAPWRGGQ